MLCYQKYPSGTDSDGNVIATEQHWLRNEEKIFSMKIKKLTTFHILLQVEVLRVFLDLLLLCTTLHGLFKDHT